MAIAEQTVRGEQPQTETTARPVNAELQRRWTRIMVALLILTGIKQIALALAYPPFRGHDEVAHLGYLRVLNQLGRLPTFSDRLPREWSEYSRFTLDWPALYTANHPPLYYLIVSPAYRLAGSDSLAQLYAVRLMAIPFFLATIWLTYSLARSLFPSDTFMALTVPSLIAFQPQLSFEGAIVNNDILAIFFGALLLVLLVRTLRSEASTGRFLLLGGVLGLGLLSKATLTVFIPAVAGVALWMCRPARWDVIREPKWWTGRAQLALALALPLVSLVLPWYLFVKRTYGDFTAFQATQELQQNWNRPAGTFAELLGSSSFHAERLRETWGYFGWKLLPLSQVEMKIIYVFLLACVVGWIVALLRIWNATERGRTNLRSLFAPYQVAGVALMVSVSLLMYGATIYFGTMFMLTQARYFFPILPAAAIVALLGLRAFVPERHQGPAAATIIAAIGTFQLALLTRLVFPYALA